MAFFTKNDLVYTDYRWKPLTGTSRRKAFFNKQHGWDMLSFINEIAEEYNLLIKAHGVRIEKMIREHMPSSIKTQQDVRSWVEVNW